MRTRFGSYMGYSIGCAGVWAVILVLAQRWSDPETRSKLRIVCGGWWMGWTSATIARLGYPPPQPLTARAEKRLQTVSPGLIALGLANTARALTSGQRRPRPIRADPS